MIKNVITALLVIMILLTPGAVLADTGTTTDDFGDTITFPLEKGASGEYLVQIQQRLLDLGYISFRATGKYGDMTVEAVREYQMRNGLSADGILGKTTYDKLFRNNNNRAYGNDSIPRTVGPVLTKVPEEYGRLMEWSEVDGKFSVGTTLKAIDFNTGKEFNMTRTGGTNHADIQPATPEDLAVLNQCFGGSYTWEKRPMLIEIGSAKIAASLFGMPNGSGDITGCGMDGSLCLYFLNSKSDVLGGITDGEHAQIIQSAASTQ